MSLVDAWDNSYLKQDFDKIGSKVSSIDFVSLFPVLENRKIDEEKVYPIIENCATKIFGGNYILTSLYEQKPQTEIPRTFKEIKSEISKMDWALSSVNQQMNDDYYLINKYQNEQLAAQKAMNFVLSIPTQITKELSVIVEILDILAGKYNTVNVGDTLLQALKSVIDSILGIVNFAVKLGFPEIPILGNLGELIEEIMIATRVLDSLPDNVKQQLAESQDRVDFMARLADVVDKEVAKLINRAADDIEIIIKNLEWLPFTLLAGIVIALLNAVKKVFDKLQLEFNIDSFLPDIKLIPSFHLDLDLEKLKEYAPPGNILDAILQALEMIPAFIMDFKGILKNSVFGLIWKLTTGLRLMDGMALDPDAVLSAAYINLLSCERVKNVIDTRKSLLTDCMYLQESYNYISASKEYKQKLIAESPDDEGTRKYREKKGTEAVKNAEKYFQSQANAFATRMEQARRFIDENDPKNPDVLSQYMVAGMDMASNSKEEFDDGGNESAEALDNLKSKFHL